MKLAVIGSRTFTNLRLLSDVLDDQRDLHDNLELISGGAIGADTLASIYAQTEGLNIEVIRPDYDKHAHLAPLVRNTEIIKKADQVLAFWDGKSHGTFDAIVKAVKAKKFVMIQGV